MPGSCGDCGNCAGFDDDVYGSGEYICKLDDTPEGCPECVGNGPCPGWVEIPEPHKIQFELRDCIAVSVLSSIKDMVGQIPMQDLDMLGYGNYVFCLHLDPDTTEFFIQEFDWALAFLCDADQRKGQNYVNMAWEKRHKGGSN